MNLHFLISTIVVCVLTLTLTTDCGNTTNELLLEYLKVEENSNKNTLLTDFYIVKVVKTYFKNESIIQLLLPKHCKETFNFRNSICNTNGFIQNIISERQLIISGFNSSMKFNYEPHNFGKFKHSSVKVIKLKPTSVMLLVNANNILGEIKSQVNMIRKDRCIWNPRLLYLIVIIDYFEDFMDKETEYAMQALNYFWGKNIFKVVLFFMYFDSYKENKLIKALPYSSKRTCGTISNSKDLHKLYLTNNISLSSFFQQSFPENFLGCPIIVATQPSSVYAGADIVGSKNNSRYNYTSGIEVNMIQVFAKHCNVDIVYKQQGLNVIPLLEIFPNGSARGILPSVDDNTVGIAFGFYGKGSEQLLYGDLTVSFYFESLPFYVPSPYHIPTYKIFSKIFDMYMWICLLITFILMNIIIGLINTFYNRKNEIKTSCAHVSNILVLFGLLLNVSEPNAPKSGLVRLLFALWAVHSFHLSTLYQQKLFSFMTNPISEKGITTIEELKNSGLKTCIQKILYRAYSGLIDADFISEIIENKVFCGENNENEAVKYILNNRNVSLILRSTHSQYFVSKYKGKLHKLPFSFLTYPIGMITSKGFIAYDCLNKCLRCIVESGLLKKFIKDEINKYKLKPDILQAPFNLNDLQGAFILLGVGLTLSLVVFVIECIYFKIYHK